MTDEPRDDEILGRALSRAIETQDVRETPFEASRIAAPRGRSFAWLGQLAIAAAVLIVSAGIAVWLTRPPSAQPVASSATPLASSAGTTSSQPTPAGASESPRASAAFVATRVFFVRDQLPPVSAEAPGNGAHIAVDRIVERIMAAHDASRTLVPAGASNPLALVDLYSVPSNISANITGDTADVEFELAHGWGVHGASQVQALVQQLVYLITEEPGIRKAHITDKGKTNAVIDGLVVDRALSREDVTDYAVLDTRTSVHGFGDASTAGSRALTPHVSVDTPTGMGRFVVETDLQSISPTVLYPDFTVSVAANDEFGVPPLPGKWRLSVVVNGHDARVFGGNLTSLYEPFGQSPVVGVLTTKIGNETVYAIGLDDLRPWRTAIAYNPFRIIVDIGGDPRTISGTNAVYGPGYGATVGHTFDVSGVEHNFEAHVDIRVLDGRDREVFKTATTGTNCCEPGGTFATTITLPVSVSGTIYLEVYEASPKDGSDLNIIRIPLVVR